MTLYETVLAETQREFPGFKVVKKADSSFMKLLSWVLFFVPGFMSNFTTTIGQTMWTPSAWDTDFSDVSQAEILRHERIHLRQQKRFTMPLFVLLYLFLPLPFGLAYGRACLEWEAYTESLKAIAEYKGVERLKLAEVKADFVGYFTSRDYFWMWPFAGAVGSWYDKVVAEIEKSS
jgi:hypothetical protein